MRGTFDPVVTVESVSAETRGLKCDPVGESGYECLGSSLSIAAGDAARIQLVIDIPTEFAASTITHTKQLMWPAGSPQNDIADNDRHVSSISIIDPARLPAVDLSIAVAADQPRCTPGGECGFSLSVTNNGPAEFDGSIMIGSRMDPEPSELTGFGPSGWTCFADDDRIDCNLDNVSLAVGESRDLTLSVRTGRTLRGRFSNCAEVALGVESRIAEVQRALKTAGYEPGIVDGIAGRRTRAAIRAYQEANGLAATGRIDPPLLGKLLENAMRADLSDENDRACASTELKPPRAEDPET